MITVGEQLAAAAELLAPVTETPRLDAEILMAEALGISRGHLLLRLDERTSIPGFETLVARRLDYEPIAYILGKWEFFSLELEVKPPALVPRPETEHLVEAVVEFVADDEGFVLDVGTGTGCVAIAIARNAPHCRVVATDISAGALEVASRNVTRHSLSHRVHLLQGDLFNALSREEKCFDVVCCNPPYVEEHAWPQLPAVVRLHEDPQALLGGEDGLTFIRLLVTETPLLLKSGGLLAFEIGVGQHDKVYTMLKGSGFDDIAFRHDLAGIKRIATARRGSA